MAEQPCAADGEEPGTCASGLESPPDRDEAMTIVWRSSHPGIPNPIYQSAPNPEGDGNRQADPQLLVHNGVLCDGIHCGKLPVDEASSFIRGLRFFCFVCDKDFCERCATDERNDHDKSHGMLKVVVPEEREINVAVRPEAGLMELVECIVTTGCVLLPDFLRYYSSIDAETEQKPLLQAFRSLRQKERSRFLQYLMASNLEQRSLFLTQYQSLDTAGRYAYLRICIGIERVVSSSSPIFDVFKREPNPLESSDEYIKTMNAHQIAGHLVCTVEAIPKAVLSNTVRRKVFVHKHGSFPTLDHLVGDLYRYPQDDGLWDSWRAGRIGTRLLDLLPGSEESELRCSIRNILSLDQVDCPAYEALSYTWKETSYERRLLPGVSDDIDSVQRRLFEVVHPVFCCGRQHLQINTGLRDALVRLRHPTEVRTLWADQICIDQSSHQERSYHIQLMKQIYNRAKRVTVWTGDEDRHSVTAYKLMEAIATRSTLLPTPTELFEDEAVTVPPPESTDWESLFRFLGRPVFTRGWVIQEIAFGRQVFVKCGENEIEFDKVMGAAAMVSQPSWFSLHKRLLSECGLLPPQLLFGPRTR